MLYIAHQFPQSKATFLARLTTTFLKQLAGLKYETVSVSHIDAYIG